ncbi:MAG: tRNA preQ1(34) S-adenosylmethionine ribosyltransferase-isomerase QueA [Rhodopirellula sp.]|nr:tRNA preQ1(34) S-adenosylmethionine ribosyltransferase-isomerase QueA [Rhodopirellula sp.]
MPDPRDHQLSSYDYLLPPERIAQAPVEPRHSARLLMVPRHGEPPSRVRHGQVWDLLELLQPGDLLVVNDTRVLKARLQVRRSGGGLSELLVLDPRGEGRWLCLARPAKRMRPGDYLTIEGTEIQLKVLDGDAASGGRIVQFPADCKDAETIEGLLSTCGEVPLPPYIDRHDPDDAARYQTRYADRPGAVAAPTAGLHFSDELLVALERKGVRLERITLHVGLGTFRPVETEDLTKLELHSEWIDVRPSVVEAVNRCTGRVIAVGTTSVRALEGAADLNSGVLQAYSGPVNLVIQPGYQFRVVQGLITNFHLPKSSLLLLVSALIGREKLLRLYAEAIQEQYRFYSYGDAMWIAPDAVQLSAQLTP